MDHEELVPLSEAKIRLHEIVRRLPARDVLLLRHGRPVAVVMDYEKHRRLIEVLEDLQDRLSVHEARSEPHDTRIALAKVKSELGIVGD